ncbi:MAG: DUF1822 family protein [Symploca sp. SIO2C1]|nr:DUF1822 family protein [Symploca sp. SIO2C1]
MIYSTERITIAIPITKADRQKAKEFAQQQPTVEKQEQVERNTLAVLVMHYYLEMLEIPTDLKASYCWNPVGRLFADVADLYIPEAGGRLECRPIREGDHTCFIPQEVWKDRIGYVVVQLNEAYKEGTVLGFVPAVSTTMLGISQLQPLDMLIEHIDEPPVQLSRWFDNIFEAGWQAVEKLFGARDLSFALGYRGEAPRFRGTTKEELIKILQTTQKEKTRWGAAKRLWKIEPKNPVGGVRRVIDLGMQLTGYSVALMVAILQKLDQSVAILIRVYPIESETYLPLDLQLSILDEAGNPLQETQTQAEEDKYYIEHMFSAESGDQFSVRVTLDSTSITENFIV